MLYSDAPVTRSGVKRLHIFWRKRGFTIKNIKQRPATRQSGHETQYVCSAAGDEWRGTKREKKSGVFQVKKLENN